MTKIVKNVDLVVSCYNEEKNVTLFYNACKRVLTDDKNYRIIFINDGSKDNTLAALLDIKNASNDKVKVKIVNFSKNFGHEMAMLAGLDESDADAVIFMDSDLQHPIEKIPQIINNIENEYNIISMVRTKNKGKSAFLEFLSKIFYRVINAICKTNFSENASDFFAIDRKVSEFLKVNYREKERFMRGIVQNIGFNKKVLHYEAGERLFGKSKYNFRILFSFAEKTLYQYTDLPLKLGKIASAISSIFGIIVLVYTLITHKGAPSGYATLVILISFMFAVLFMIVGMIGEYLSIMLREIKNRPSYIIDNIIE